MENIFIKSQEEKAKGTYLKRIIDLLKIKNISPLEDQPFYDSLVKMVIESYSKKSLVEYRKNNTQEMKKIFEKEVEETRNAVENAIREINKRERYEAQVKFMLDTNPDYVEF